MIYPLVVKKTSIFWKYVNSKRKTKGGIGDLVQVDETGHETTANSDAAIWFF